MQDAERKIAERFLGALKGFPGIDSPVGATAQTHEHRRRAYAEALAAGVRWQIWLERFGAAIEPVARNVVAPGEVAHATEGGNEDLPWDDCKLAFSVEDDEAVWRSHKNGKLSLPEDWEFVGTDCTGARCMAIFRVNGMLRIEDGLVVQQALKIVGEM